jgi:Ferric reductase like transmembrane component
MSILSTAAGARPIPNSLVSSDLPLPSTVLLVASTGITTPSVESYSVTNSDPTTPPIQDDHQWITAYLTIHQLSTPSYRYMYILWLAVVLIFLVFVVLHWTGASGGAVGGLWNKWSLRRRTWRKQHSLAEARRKGTPYKQPLSLPSNAQLLSLATLYIATFSLCFLGPDYIAPGTHVWDLKRHIAARGTHTHLDARIDRALTTSTISQSRYTISKAWWTAGGRTGTMAFALIPLCILFALKSPPFALFSLPFLIQIYNDKLAFLHRWAGRLIWLVTTLHVALWGMQLSRDKRSTDNSSSVWLFAFQYDKFVFGWLVGFSLYYTFDQFSLIISFVDLGIHLSNASCCIFLPPIQR